MCDYHWVWRHQKMTWWVSCILNLLLYIHICVVIIPDPHWDIMIKLTEIKINFPHQLGNSFLYWFNSMRIPKCSHRSHGFKFDGSTIAPLYQSITSSALEMRAFNPADPEIAQKRNSDDSGLSSCYILNSVGWWRKPHWNHKCFLTQVTWKFEQPVHAINMSWLCLNISITEPGFFFMWYIGPCSQEKGSDGERCI